MQLYAILRREGFADGPDLQEAAARSTKVGDEEMSDRIRWIRSYVLDEDSGRLGTLCIYEASDPEAIREHAARANLPVDEIIAIADTVIVRPDPDPDPASAAA
jgi:sporulation protein YlmC with PRC-barrel domain